MGSGLSGISVERRSLCCMDASPVNHGLWLRQEIEAEHLGERKNSGIQRWEIHQGRCEETDTWYLSTGGQPHGRMQVKINGLSKL